MAYKEKRYCAFCKNLRTYYMKKHISFLDFVICALASMSVMALVWQDFNIKVFYFFVFAVVICESLVRLRWRMKMICDICGFDPILYKRNPQEAAKLVKNFLAKRQSDPKMLLKPHPQLTSIKRSSLKAREKDDSAKLVTKASDKSPLKTPVQAPGNIPGNIPIQRGRKASDSTMKA